MVTCTGRYSALSCTDGLVSQAVVVDCIFGQKVSLLAMWQI